MVATSTRRLRRDVNMLHLIIVLLFPSLWELSSVLILQSQWHCQYLWSDPPQVTHPLCSDFHRLLFEGKQVYYHAFLSQKKNNWIWWCERPKFCGDVDLNLQNPMNSGPVEIILWILTVKCRHIIKIVNHLMRNFFITQKWMITARYKYPF